MKKISFGNLKIPSSTLIINMSSAHECCCKDVCKFGISKKCYALKSEIRFPNVRESRAAQTEYWRTTSNEQKLLDFAELWKKHPRKMPTIKAVRFNEAGDMRDMDDLNLLIDLANKYKSVQFYSYSHNKQLMDPVSIYDLPLNLSINLSYKHHKTGFNTFVLDTDYERGETISVCPGDCRKCNLCLTAKGLKIGVKIH